MQNPPAFLLETLKALPKASGRLRIPRRSRVELKEAMRPDAGPVTGFSKFLNSSLPPKINA